MKPSDDAIVHDGLEAPVLCQKCGREMTTVEAKRSDLCPSCDPPNGPTPDRDERGGHGF